MAQMWPKHSIGYHRDHVVVAIGTMEYLLASKGPDWWWSCSQGTHYPTVRSCSLLCTHLSSYNLQVGLPTVIEIRPKQKYPIVYPACHIVSRLLSLLTVASSAVTFMDYMRSCSITAHLKAIIS